MLYFFVCLAVPDLKWSQRAKPWGCYFRLVAAFADPSIESSKLYHDIFCFLSSNLKFQYHLFSASKIKFEICFAPHTSNFPMSIFCVLHSDGYFSDYLTLWKASDNIAILFVLGLLLFWVSRTSKWPHWGHSTTNRCDLSWICVIFIHHNGWTDLYKGCCWEPWTLD